MDNNFFESAPVIYNTSALKVIHNEFKSHFNIFRLHWHERMEFLRIKSGKLNVVLGTKETEATEGDLVIIPPKRLHRGYTSDQAVKYDVVMFDIRSFYNQTDICKELLPAIYEGNVLFKSVSSNPETIRCIDFISANHHLEGLEAISYVYQLLNSLFKNELIEFSDKPKDMVVKEITEYMEKHFSEDISTLDLCNKFGYTQSHLCRKFKKSTGLSPISYLTIIRLEYAGKLIKSGNESINHIASESGFSDSNYFTRCFKKHFGMSPTEYRKKRLK